MRYIAAPQVYWPIWLAFTHYGYSKLGMLVGGVAVVVLWFVMWRVQHGTWKLGV